MRKLILKNSNRSFLHRRNLPVRGQRTSTNARTQKKRGNLNRYPRENKKDIRDFKQKNYPFPKRLFHLKIK